MRLDKAVQIGRIRFERLLLIIVLIELLLGGNGYLTEIAGIRLRVWLVVTCMAFVAYRLLRQPSEGIPIQIWGLFFLFLFTVSFGASVGLLNENRIGAIINELKPLLYFPMLLFYTIAIRNEGDVALVTKLLVMCGIAQAVAYLGLIFAVHSGAIPYSMVYLTLRDSSEFIFRERDMYHGFFYKSAFHLGVAILFLWFDPLWKNRGLALFLIAAIVLTFTRGLVAALVLTFAYSMLLNADRRTIFTLFLTVLTLLAAVIFTDLLALLQRPLSDAVRLADLRTLHAELDITMLLIGDGLGAVIGERERIEMTYIEILYKQGLIGLMFWGVLFLLNFVLYRRIVDGALRQQAFVFHLATFYVYSATATNTFLTGSIGMAIVLISTSVLFVFNNMETRVSGQGVLATGPLPTP